MKYYSLIYMQNPSTIFSKFNPTMYRKIAHYDQMEFIPGVQADLTFKNQCNTFHQHVKKLYNHIN